MTTHLPQALDGIPLVVVDVEGNGQQPPEIVEIAVLPVNGAPVRGEDIRSWLVRPELPITEYVTRNIHHISNGEVAHCPPWTALAGDVAALLNDRVLVAHNANVEYRILSQQLPRWKPLLVLDTLRLARHVWPGRKEGYSLTTLCGYAEVDTSGVPDQRPHHATYDAWCAWRLLLTLLDHSKLDWDGLVKLATPLSFLPPEEPGGGLW